MRGKQGRSGLMNPWAWACDATDPKLVLNRSCDHGLSERKMLGVGHRLKAACFEEKCTTRIPANLASAHGAPVAVFVEDVFQLRHRIFVMRAPGKIVHCRSFDISVAQTYK